MDKQWSFQLFILWSVEILFCFGTGGEETCLIEKLLWAWLLKRMHLQEISQKLAVRYLKRGRKYIPKPVFLKQCLNMLKGNYFKKYRKGSSLECFGGSGFWKSGLFFFLGAYFLVFFFYLYSMQFDRSLHNSQVPCAPIYFIRLATFFSVRNPTSPYSVSICGYYVCISVWKVKIWSSKYFYTGLYVCLHYVVSVSKVCVCAHEKYIYNLDVRP